MSARGEFDGQAGSQAGNEAARSPAAPPPVPPLSRLLVSDEEGAALYHVSRRRFHELRAEAWMPPPIVLGPRQLRWSRAELEAAIAHMPRQRDPSEPAALARARIDNMKRGP